MFGKIGKYMHLDNYNQCLENIGKYMQGVAAYMYF
jgi:hypothetical protein